jgi:hypothetical protein
MLIAAMQIHEAIFNNGPRLSDETVDTLPPVVELISGHRWSWERGKVNSAGDCAGWKRASPRTQGAAPLGLLVIWICQRTEQNMD